MAGLAIVGHMHQERGLPLQVLRAAAVAAAALSMACMHDEHRLQGTWRAKPITPTRL